MKVKEPPRKAEVYTSSTTEVSSALTRPDMGEPRNRCTVDLNLWSFSI